jgi:hypothetical protein
VGAPSRITGSTAEKFTEAVPYRCPAKMVERTAADAGIQIAVQIAVCFSNSSSEKPAEIWNA